MATYRNITVRGKGRSSWYFNSDKVRHLQHMNGSTYKSILRLSYVKIRSIYARLWLILTVYELLQ